MKTPRFDWENSSDEFIRAYENNAFEGFQGLNRSSVEDILVADVARAQRMAAAGLRHLRVILGANRNRGKLDRWRNDALAPVYFGRVSTVAAIRSVRRRLERAHRRLRDDVLHIRLREQRHAGPTTAGRNVGGFLSARRFQLFPQFAGLSGDRRAAVIVHELLHEWLIDQKIGNRTAYEDDEVRRLASQHPSKARINPGNFDRFLTEVWRDEGLEAPSGAIKRDLPLRLVSTAANGATGLLSDRPVLSPATMGGRRDLAFVGLRARSDQSLIPAIFEYDAQPIARRGQDQPTGETSFAPSCCTLPDGTVITAVAATGENNRLKLIAWDVENETSNRIGDSGELYGDTLSQPDVIALGGGRMCVVFKGGSGRMKVDLVEFSRTSGFRRYANAETSGPIDDHGRACLVRPVDDLYGGADEDSPNRVTIATAFRTREGRLSMDIWRGDFGARRITREGGIVEETITGRPGIAALALDDRPRVVTAGRDTESGRLRLTCYDVTSPERPRRLADNGLAGPRMTHSPDIVTVMEGFEQQVASAIRYSENGRIIVSTWRVDEETGFERVRYSGADTSPQIESTPSLMAVEGRESEDLLTAAIGRNGDLAMALWGEPEPVRVHG